MAVIKDVAKLAGVSVGTVSKYLNQNGNLKEQTRARVEAAIRELQYKPSPAARSMRTGKTNTLAVVTPGITNPFFAELYDAIRQSALQNGYIPELYTTDDKSLLKNDLRSISRKHVDGIILCFVDEEETITRFLKELEKSIPVVLLTWDIRNDQYNCVSVDVFEGARKAAAHLIAMGHRRIGYVGGRDRVSREKRGGFVRALGEAGLMSLPDIQFYGDYGLRTGYCAAREFCTLPDMPTAIFAENDILAIGCMKYLLQKNIRVPQSVAVIGFDNIQLSAMYEPSLSTVALPIGQMGSEAVGLLLSALNGNHSGKKMLILKSRLMVRSSTDGNAPVEWHP